MNTYRDLNLKSIREATDLDFAHYTYKRGMCSCCCGPQDLPSIYWKNRIIRQDNDYTYILFKNADNGSGHIKNKDEKIKHYTCISYKFKDDNQKQMVCEMLREQLDDDYIVCVPKSSYYCIVICDKQKFKDVRDEFKANYDMLY